jgi:glycosyltransferase involved in cell wall biosynthesis
MDTGGVRETLIEAQTGFVVEQGDLQGMATTTAALLSDRDRRADIGRAGRTFVQEHLSTEAMIDGYAAVLADAITGARRSDVDTGGADVI